MTTNDQATHFLETFAEYLEWRLHHKNEKPEPLEFEQSFTVWLQTFGRDETHSEFRHLVSNMQRMKDPRGTDIPERRGN